MPALFDNPLADKEPAVAETGLAEEAVSRLKLNNPLAGGGGLRKGGTKEACEVYVKKGLKCNEATANRIHGTVGR
jgi:hypothetical protein